MTETEARDLIDSVDCLNEITSYIIDQKLKINELINEIINLKCERNDWKQRAESAEQRYDNLIQSSNDKETPKAVTHTETLARDCTCPRCGNVISRYETFGNNKVQMINEYCHFCGQHLKREDE
ncbi:MAG: hypothetical protein NC131_01170 [Roseburia sp.]|nr:hypothetical protein [Roseburia sp.]